MTSVLKVNLILLGRERKRDGDYKQTNKEKKKKKSKNKGMGVGKYMDLTSQVQRKTTMKEEVRARIMC